MTLTTCAGASRQIASSPPRILHRRHRQVLRLVPESPLEERNLGRSSYPHLEPHWKFAARSRLYQAATNRDDQGLTQLLNPRFGLVVALVFHGGDPPTWIASHAGRRSTLTTIMSFVSSTCPVHESILAWGLGLARLPASFQYNH